MGGAQGPGDEGVTPAGPGPAGVPAEAAPDEPVGAEAFAEPGEADFADPPVPDPTAPHPKEGWRRRTATGAILSGLALGFQQVFEDKHQDVSVIMETSGVPPTDLPVEAEFDHQAPRRSVVRIRPWLLEADGTGPDGTGPDEGRAGPGAAGEV